MSREAHVRFWESPGVQLPRATRLPLHRLEKIFRREGLRLARSTLCGFVQGSVVLLGRIVDAMWEDAKANARWISIDATGVLVFAKEKCHRHHFWVVVAERNHVLFRYTKTHDGLVPATLLEGYRGYVLADASSVYHELYRREPGIIECGCWSHSRRMAFDALSSDEPRALVIIGFIGLLYDAHLLATDPKTGVTDGGKRRAAAQPVIDRLYAWIAAERPKVDDETPIAKAMNYLLNHRVPLTRFLDDGLLRLDNNLSEISSSVARRWAATTGSSAGATTAPTGTRRWSPWWRAANSTTSSPGPTSAMC